MRINNFSIIRTIGQFLDYWRKFISFILFDTVEIFSDFYINVYYFFNVNYFHIMFSELTIAADIFLSVQLLCFFYV